MSCFNATSVQPTSLDSPCVGTLTLPQIPSLPLAIDFHQLAEQFFLSYDLVMQAKAVFDTYRAMDSPPDKSLNPHASTRSPVETANSVHTAVPGLDTSIKSLGSSPVDNLLTTRSAEMQATAPLEFISTISAIQQQQLQCGISSSCIGAMGITAGDDVERIGVRGLQAFFLDLGIPTSTLEIAETIQRMEGEPEALSLLKRQDAIIAEAAEREKRSTAEAEREKVAMAAAVATEGSETQRTGPVVASGALKATSKGMRSGTRRKKSSVASSTTHGDMHEASAPTLVAALPSPPPIRGLSFPSFLFLLQQRLSEEDDTVAAKDAEVAEAFRLLDVDGDGVLSSQDLLQAVADLMYEEGTLAEDRDLLMLSSMHPAELRAALFECDMDADGVVTLSDMLAVMRV